MPMMEARRVGDSVGAFSVAQKASATTGVPLTKVKSSAFEYSKTMKLTIGKKIGEGAFAKVLAAYSHTQNRWMAVKKVVKRPDSSTRCKCLAREIDILRHYSHPHVIATHQIVETEQNVYFLMDLAANGDLLDLIQSRMHIPEREARYLFAQMIEGMHYLHSNSIAHRDLKCENIFLDHNMNVKIADFGLGIDVSFHPARTACGTHAYSAPEVLRRSSVCYDALKADVWSMGTVLFTMVSGELAFGNTPAMKIVVHFPTSISLSKAVKDIILRILKRNPSSRPDCTELAHDVWMTSGPSEQPLPYSTPMHTDISLRISK